MRSAHPLLLFVSLGAAAWGGPPPGGGEPAPSRGPALAAHGLPGRGPATTTTVALDFTRVDVPPHLTMSRADAVDAFTLEQSIRIARRDNPKLRAARERVEMARGDLRARGASINPEVYVGASLVPSPREGDEARSRFLDTDETFIRKTFLTSGKRTHRTRSGRALLDAAIAELRKEDADLVRTVKLAYVDVQVAQESVRVVEDAYRISLTLSSAAHHLFDLGLVPRTNVLRTEVDVSQAEQQVLRRHGELRAREEALGASMFRAPGIRTAAADDLGDPAPPFPLNAAMGLADLRRPKIEALRWSVRSLRAEVDLRRAERRPDLTVHASFTDRLTNGGNPPIVASITWPLWDRGAVRGEVDRVRAQARSREHELSVMRRQVAAEVVTAYHRVETATRTLEIARRTTLPQTGALLGKARGAYLGGSGTLLDVLDAQRVYRQAALDQLESRGDLAKGVATLEWAIGPDGTMKEPTRKSAVWPGRRAGASVMS